MADSRFYPQPNFASLDAADSSLERSRVVILPVPYDSTVSARAGTRDGPRAIIEASADMELYDVGLGMEPWRHGIHTLPEVAPHTGSPEAMADRIESVVGELLDAAKFVVTLGGEHTVAVGAVLPATPFAHALGFGVLPIGFFLALALMVVCYLVLIEFAKRWFFRTAPITPGTHPDHRARRIHRRAARFTTTSDIARHAR